MMKGLTTMSGAGVAGAAEEKEIDIDALVSIVLLIVLLILLLIVLLTLLLRLLKISFDELNYELTREILEVEVILLSYRH